MPLELRPARIPGSALTITLALLLACLGLAPATARACGPYSVALYEFGSLGYFDAQRQPQGVDKDVVEALARRSGCVLNTRVDSRARIWEQLKQGSLEMTVSGVATPEREQLAEFWPYLGTRNYALMSRETARRLASFDEFLADPKRQLLVVRSFKHGQQIDAWIEQLRALKRVSEVGDFPTALKVLKAGRGDLMFAHPMVLEHWRGDAMKGLTMLDWAPGDSAIGSIVASKTLVSAADRQLMRRHLAAMVAEGEIERILSKHVGAEVASRVRLPPGTQP